MEWNQAKILKELKKIFGKEYSINIGFSDTIYETRKILIEPNERQDVNAIIFFGISNYEINSDVNSNSDIQYLVVHDRESSGQLENVNESNFDKKTSEIYKKIIDFFKNKDIKKINSYSEIF